MKQGTEAMSTSTGALQREGAKATGDREGGKAWIEECRLRENDEVALLSSRESAEQRKGSGAGARWKKRHAADCSSRENEAFVSAGGHFPVPCEL
ncbi:hypothetical protein Cni_G03797 [Canna indica]|uniref:Uncharacterized protein n=1 Tax=Canna indica TaxID=4628 RepID=A0AAQ3JVF1_9LILI|nr:hypothetical protein Cni_G03797 [Canna indica]